MEEGDNDDALCECVSILNENTFHVTSVAKYLLFYTCSFVFIQFMLLECISSRDVRAIREPLLE